MLLNKSKLANPLTRKPANCIYSVILAGGEGKRLWPVSRQDYPKYCMSVGRSKKSLLQEAYDRLRALTAGNNIFVVTQKSQKHLIRNQLSGFKKENIIVEPFGKNTAAAIGLAAGVIGKIAPDAVMVIVPADQYIPDKKAFKKLMQDAATFAVLNNSLVTIGIKPDRPATGYGYIKLRRQKTEDRKQKKKNSAYQVDKFVEKPNLEKAKKYIKEGYLWNSGMFVWEVTAILEAMRDNMPALCKHLIDIDNGKSLASAYNKINSVSIDNGILEKSKNVYVIPSDLKWDDVGSWTSLSRILSLDKYGNAIDANFKGIKVSNCVIIAEDKTHMIAAYGLKDTVIVQARGITLVCPKDKAEAVKELVNYIYSG